MLAAAKSGTRWVSQGEPFTHFLSIFVPPSRPVTMAQRRPTYLSSLLFRMQHSIKARHTSSWNSGNMSTTVDQLILEHHTNPVNCNTDYISQSDKSWIRKYPAITKLAVHSYPQPGGAVTTMFDGPFLPQYEDDGLRGSQPAYPPNERSWVLNSKDDNATFFHTEVSNIVLAGWTKYPPVHQASKAPPSQDKSIPETVDIVYTAKPTGMNGENSRQITKVPLVIGEFKSRVIHKHQWQNGELQGSQKILSQELRGCVSSQPDY